MKDESDQAGGVAVGACFERSVVAAFPCAKVGGAPASVGTLQAEQVGNKVAALVGCEE